MKKPPLSPQMADSLRKAVNIEYPSKDRISDNLFVHSFKNLPFIAPKEKEILYNNLDNNDTQGCLEQLCQFWERNFDDFILTELSQKLKTLGYIFRSKYALERFITRHIHCLMETGTKTKHIFLKNRDYDYLPLISFTAPKQETTTIDKGNNIVTIKSTHTFKTYRHDESDKKTKA